MTVDLVVFRCFEHIPMALTCEKYDYSESFCLLLVKMTIDSGANIHIHTQQFDRIEQSEFAVLFNVQMASPSS